MTYVSKGKTSTSPGFVFEGYRAILFFILFSMVFASTNLFIILRKLAKYFRNIDN